MGDIKIQNGTTYNDVATFSTKAQERAFLLFDYNSDGCMQSDEAKNFKMYNCQLKSDCGPYKTLSLEKKDNEKCKIELEYSQNLVDELKCLQVEADGISLKRNNEYYHNGPRVSVFGNSFDVKFNIDKMTLKIKNLNGDKPTIIAAGITELDVSDSNPSDIGAQMTQKVTISNTNINNDAWHTNLWTSKQTAVGIMDDKSNIDIQRIGNRGVIGCIFRFGEHRIK